MAKQDVTVELFYDSVWHDVTFAEEVYTRDQIEITHGAADEVTATPPSNASFTLANPDGKHNPRNPKSPLFGIARNLPSRITVDSDTRSYGEASSWSPRWPIKGPAWTEVRTAGILRRLGQGQDPLRSALRRYITAQDPVAYWSFAEGQASEFISLTAGAGSPFTRYAFSGPGTFEPGAGELAPWSGPGCLLRGDVDIVAAVGMADSPTDITIDMIVKGDSFTGGDALSIILDGPLGDGSDSWQIDMYASLEEIDVFEPGAGSNVNTYPGLFDGNAQRHIRFTAEQSGADILYTLYIDDVATVSDTVAATTLAPIRRILLSPGADGLSIGDVAVWSGSPPGGYYTASIGYVGETTGNRFERLCTEEGITSSVVGDVDDCPEMGPQFPDTLLNLLREIETTDDGFIYDLRSGSGLGMRTGRACWNQDPALELNWDAYHVAPPTDPVVDDMFTRNDVTAARRSGGTARAVRESGPLNVSDPTDDPEGVGRYTHQVDVNPFSDLVLGDYAGWHLHRGTVDETRWPAVTIDLDATPEVDVSVLEIGDRITIANMPAEITPDIVSLIVVGWVETVGSHRRRITYNCVPESPLHIAEIEHADYSFVGSDGSTVNTAFVAGTGTSLSVAVAAGYPLWAFESTFDILVSGVRLRVTAIAGASSPQTFTVQAAPINGVTKTIAAGEKVDLFHKSYIGL